MDTTVSVSVTDTVSDSDTVSVKEKEKEKESPAQTSKVSDTAKASKHKYGEYHNVLLKDEELQALQRDYSNWEELIKYLDEYIEMKGYKAKSHYLCIKKWVVDAVKEKQKKPEKTNNPFLDILRKEQKDEQKGDNSSFGSNENVISSILSQYTVE